MEAISDTSLLASGGYDRTLRLWQANSGKCMRIIPFDHFSHALELSPDKRFLAACGFRCLRVYEVNTIFENPLIVYAVENTVTRVGFQEDFKWMFTAGEDCRLRIWDMSSGFNRLPCSREFDCQSPINAACLHPNQMEIAVGLQNGGVFMFDLRSDNHFHVIPEAGAFIQDIAISPNGQYLAVVNNKGVCYILTLYSSGKENMSTMQMKQRINAHPRSSLRCKFSPDSSMLVTTSDDGIRIWKADDFQLWTELSVEDKWMWDANFSPDSKGLFTASSDGMVRLWNLETKVNEIQYIGHTSAVTALSFKN